MSEPRRFRMLVGGAGGIRFGVPLTDVERVKEWDELEFPRRVVDLPRIFDLEPASEEDDRYARIEALEETAYVRLGPVVRAHAVRDDRVEAIPAILRTVAARWGWRAIALTDDAAVIVVDPVSLARIGARREEAPA